MTSPLLVIGLGNPGAPYNTTRHNAGAETVRRFAKRTGNVFATKERLFAEVAENRIHGRRIILACPTTYMNQSGKTAAALARFFKVSRNNVVLVHDDMDLPLGVVRIGENRGAGGHKGVASVFRSLGGQETIRIRIGTMGSAREQRPGHRALRTIVVKKLTPEEKRLLLGGIKRADEALERIIKEGPAKAMAISNR